MTRVGLSVLVAVVLTSSDVTLLTQQVAPTATMATVRASVEDADRRFVQDLRTAQFDVQIDGSPHAVEVGAPSAAPLTLLLLVDMSISHTMGSSSQSTPFFHNFGWLVDGLEKDLLPLLTSSDRLRVGRFVARRVDLNDAFLTDRDQRATAIRTFTDLQTIDRMDRLGPSPIWDAIATAAHVLAPEPAPRAILVVTDGKATANRLGMEDAAREVARLGVTVVADYEPVWASSHIDPHIAGDRLLRPLAELTGGIMRTDDSFAKGGWTTPPPPFAPLIEALRSSYTLHIPTDGLTPGLHELDVRVTRPGLRVHAPRWIAVDGN